MAYRKGKKFARRKPMRKAGGVILPKTNPMKTNRDFRFKQMNPYKIKPEPFPRVLYTRMKYADEFTLVLTGADIANGKSYRVNSIYDPDFTGAVSKTTVGWSNMSAIYGKYLVTGCKIDVDFNNPVKDGARVGVRLRQNNSLTALGQSLQQLAEQPMTYISGLNNTGSQKKHFSFFVRPWSLLGLSKLEYFANTSIYAPDLNANPALNHNGYFDVFMVNIGDAADTVDVVVKIVYYVELFNRIALTSSTLA